ncbi:MAG: hypothetical protein U0944_01865 [Candidatus Moranbacteria bacterium]|nr:hypothetical protein [bacterium]MDP1834003.1 hypothetical protein [Candidatus Moranbacteria bacterium]MDZ4385143.1 hypothetical protein [Candidatus Moranbacteria bacterium]
MKLKILFTPLMLVIIIYLAIWVAIPAYSGPEGVVATGKKLQGAELKLADISLKEENAGSLVAALNDSSEQQKILLQYLPEKKTDEDVIANLNSIASGAGVFLSGVTMDDESPVAVVQPEEAFVLDENGNEVPVEVAPKTVAKNFKASVALVGDYERLRQFIADVSRLKRFNEIVSMKITKNSGSDNGALQMDAVIRFNYLDKTGSIASMSNEVFSMGMFDMGVIDKIKAKTNMDVFKVEAGSIGRSNPFSAS